MSPPEDQFAKAVANRESSVGGYVHLWTVAPGAMEYVANAGSRYAEEPGEKPRSIAETAPDIDAR